MSNARRIANLMSRSRMDRKIDEELKSHLEMRVDDNCAAGMSREEARRDALLRFGNPVVMRERVAGADTALKLYDLWADVRYALRRLRRSPGFACTAILILGLGIGACTAIFSAIKPILLDSLPYPHAGRLMMIWEMRRAGGPMDVSFGTFRGLEERNHSFTAMAVMKPWQLTMVAKDSPERFEGQRVSADYFRTLGISPRLGRNFIAEDDSFHGPNLVILSNRLWRRSFAGDKTVIGRQVRLDGDSYTVIGVMPRPFENVLAPSAELWAPLQYDPSLPSDGKEWGHHLRMVGRLKNGVTLAQAESQLDLILPTLAQEHAKGYDSSGGAPAGMIVNELQSDLTSAVRPALLAVLGAVVLVLLICCVNVTNLFLARGVQRQAEFALRAALGASRTRMIRQMLTESLLLAGLGAVFGMMVAFVGVRALIALSPPGMPRLSAIGVHAGVFLFGLGITTALGVVVGLIPALQASRKDLQTGLRQNSQRTAGGRKWMRPALVVAEVSLAAVLLVCTGLLLHSMQQLFAVDPGFDGKNLLTMQVQESGHQFNTDTASLRFFTQALEKVRQVPGVLSAGFTTQLPLSGDSDTYGVEVEGKNDPAGDPALRYAVTPGYVETMHTPLLRGRLLNEQDAFGAPVAVLLSESLAHREFPGQDPIGRRVRVGPDAGHADKPWATIVGVVGNVKQHSLAVGDEDAFYISTQQWAWVDSAQSLVVRARGNAAALTAAIRNAVWSVDKDEPIVHVATMDDLLAASETERHFVLMLFGAFALVGLVLAATGIYGVIAGSVSERTREIGVRSALGASRGNILLLVMRQGLTFSIFGVLIGLTAAVAASTAIASLLFGVTLADPLTYAGVTALLILVSGVACFVPARRAASIHPIEALRAE
jgi:putative ABC transport system permease protein